MFCISVAYQILSQSIAHRNIASSMHLWAMMMSSATMSSLSTFSPSFDTPSAAIADNMPIGNGELVANIWVNASDGSLSVLLGRSDAWSSLAMPIKVGRLKLLVHPSPFLRPDSFTQKLHIENGTIEISARRGNLSAHACLRRS